MVTSLRAGPPPPSGAPWDVPILEAELAFIDLEMTGLDPTVDRVIELCVDRGTLRGEKRRLLRLVRPDDGRFGNERIHGISEASLSGAPTMAELAQEVLAHLEGAVLVAHGARYDVMFLEAELARLGQPRLFPHYLDTLTLSRRVFGFESHALSALCKSLGVAASPNHRADGDVDALEHVFDAVVAELKPATLRDLWHVKIGQRVARPSVMAALQQAKEAAAPVRVRYRPSGKAQQDLEIVVTTLRYDLDPPKVLGYLLPGRGRKELRVDRVLSVTPSQEVRS